MIERVIDQMIILKATSFFFLWILNVHVELLVLATLDPYRRESERTHGNTTKNMIGSSQFC
jgi:hypothetical protein